MTLQRSFAGDTPDASAPLTPQSHARLARMRSCLDALGSSTELARDGFPFVLDYAFSARQELDALEAMLVRLPAREGQAARCGDSPDAMVQRHVVRTCRAIRRMLRSVVAGTRPDREDADRRVLRTYLRRCAAQAGLPDAARLERICEILGELIGGRRYHGLEIGDRVLILSLQHDVLTWLGPPRGTPEDARRIWSDLMKLTAAAGR